MEIVRQITVSEREVEDVVKSLARSNGASSSNQPGGEGPTEEDFNSLETDLSDNIADIHDLAKFTAQLHWSSEDYQETRCMILGRVAI
ncbi:hypothetical protein BDZ91DRAFT_804142 [Kalaharituber pfeilii]|nr:hypothetical protein BDZ91DRAFT_804142 [Kalaharituber pfeilii]